MDAQYPFASREDIWRVTEELKGLYATQLEHADRLARLERRKEDDARLRSVWGPLSPLPSAMCSTPQQDPTYNPTADAFKSFDQGHQHGLVNNLSMDSEEEPRRGASRANSVRFDESAIHGYGGQPSRSATDLLPLRTGSGLGSHPLTERSLSHRSDGRQSSSGHSHHSARTNSFGLEGSRLLGSASGSLHATTPPPGLFILGPVPCIIRCWLTTTFSNDSLLYAAVCCGSYRSSLAYPMIASLGLESQILDDNGVRSIKLPLYLPEASVHHSSPRSGSPTPQLPSITVHFQVRDIDPHDESIQIFLGSDVLRAHNADILFSQDKIMMMDDERNKISVPLVRPENDATFRDILTASDSSRVRFDAPNFSRPTSAAQTSRSENEKTKGPTSQDPSSAPLGRTSPSPYDREKSRTAHFEDEVEVGSPELAAPKSIAASESSASTSAKTDGGVWTSWRRDSNTSATSGPKSTRSRSMKILKPSKSMSSSRQASSVSVATTEPARREGQAATVGSSSTEIISPTPSRQPSSKPGDGPWAKPRVSNPVGGASAFGWLNSGQPPRRTSMNPE